MEYEGNCCLDANYNFQCDVLESEKTIQSEGTVLNIECGPFKPCPIGTHDYLNTGELCHVGCVEGQCVLMDCKIPDCFSGLNCRSPANFCDSNNKCVVLS